MVVTIPNFNNCTFIIFFIVLTSGIFWKLEGEKKQQLVSYCDFCQICCDEIFEKMRKEKKIIISSLKVI